VTTIERPSASAQPGSPLALEGPTYIPKERYFDPAFFDLENKRLWRHVWQVACREDEVPNTGDFVEYRILDQSILIVRGADGNLRALTNACRHRATQLGVGSGRFVNERIVCPFHGWQWNLEGESTFVSRPEAFPAACLDTNDLKLGEIKLDIWAGYVFVNPDPEAVPLLDFLAPMREVLDDLQIGDMQVEWWKGAEIDCNWKIGLEAFMEGYHVQTTHPQMGAGLDFPVDYVLKYTPAAHGHSYYHTDNDRTDESPFVGSSEDMDNVFLQSMDCLSRDLESMVVPRDMEILQTVREKPVPDGSSMSEEFIAALYRENGRVGIKLPEPSPDVLSRWSGVFFIFPNFFILPQYGNALIYRARPLGPERCLFELQSISMQPEGVTRPRPEMTGPFGPYDSENWPVIPLQDFGNVELQQRGLHQDGFEKSRLSNVYEVTISNFHAEIDRIIASYRD
jgi:phenylpropionate dioxygenase-like ring-hydroxylating dioxygenase large terminal subunit